MSSAAIIMISGWLIACLGMAGYYLLKRYFLKGLFVPDIEAGWLFLLWMAFSLVWLGAFLVLHLTKIIEL